MRLFFRLFVRDLSNNAALFLTKVGLKLKLNCIFGRFTGKAYKVDYTRFRSAEMPE